MTVAKWTALNRFRKRIDFLMFLLFKIETGNFISNGIFFSILSLYSIVKKRFFQNRLWRVAMHQMSNDDNAEYSIQIFV